MKTFKKKQLISLLLTVVLIGVLMVVPTSSIAAQSPVNLRTTSTFAVLAGETITNTGDTTINGTAPEGGGDVGLYPGSDFPGEENVTLLNGSVHINDTAAIKAKTDLVAAYDEAAGGTPVTTIPTELGGTTLKPGVYDSDAGTFQITGTLTLDADGNPDGVFIFKTASTLITATDSIINPINGAQYCRIFWQVGSSATLGVNSDFVGHIFAYNSIAAQTRATIQGQLLAQIGAVTLDSNKITNGVCEITSTPTPTITPTPTVTPTPIPVIIPETQNPKTSDSGTIGFVLLAIVSAGTAILAKRKLLSHK